MNGTTLKESLQREEQGEREMMLSQGKAWGYAQGVSSKGEKEFTITLHQAGDKGGMQLGACAAILTANRCAARGGGILSTPLPAPFPCSIHGECQPLHLLPHPPLAGPPLAEEMTDLPKKGKIPGLFPVQGMVKEMGEYPFADLLQGIDSQ